MSSKILVIDDDPTTVTLVKRCLEFNGYTILSASDGEEGLMLMRHTKPDLIILDVQMPKMNGYAFILEIKNSGEQFKDIPIIVQTAKDGMSELFKVEGVKDYILKPFNHDLLLTCVRKYL